MNAILRDDSPATEALPFHLATAPPRRLARVANDAPSRNLLADLLVESGARHAVAGNGQAEWETSPFGDHARADKPKPASTDAQTKAQGSNRRNDGIIMVEGEWRSSHSVVAIAFLRRADTFFTLAVTSIGKTMRGAKDAAIHLTTLAETLKRPAVELREPGLELSRETARRKAAEEELKQARRDCSELSEHLDGLQKESRRLSRQLLSAQEEERKRISRELHDVIAQTLTGINLRLGALKREAAAHPDRVEESVANAQQMVDHSIGIVHQFARELRPTTLDDLGLVHRFMKTFTE